MTIRKPYTLLYNIKLLSFSENAEQIDEEIDKVEIERQGSKKSHFLSALTGIRCLKEHLFDFLGVVSRESNKDEDTDVTENHRKAVTLHKEIDNGSNNQSDQCHKQYLTHRRKIGLRGIAYQGHCAKGACGNEEHRSDG